MSAATPTIQISAPATLRPCASARPPVSEPGTMTSRGTMWLSLALGLAAFALDRLHKYLQVDVFHWPAGYDRPLLPFLDLTLTFNTGVSYGLLSSLPFFAVAVIVVIALGALIVWWARATSPLVKAGLAICIGGAFSNALDRLIYR